MWYPVSETVPTEPISLSEAQNHVFADEGDFTGSLEALIAAARAHVEAYCNRIFADRSMVWACDSFADFARLPAAPVISVTSIIYTNQDGETEALAPEVYDLRRDGFNAWVVRRHGQTWPQTQPGSQITLTAQFGGPCPPDVKHAMLLLIGDGFTTRGNAQRPVWTAVDALLANHRRGAWS